MDQIGDPCAPLLEPIPRLSKLYGPRLSTFTYSHIDEPSPGLYKNSKKVEEATATSLPTPPPALLLLMLSLPALSPCPSHPVWNIDVAAAVRTEDEALLAGAGGVLTCLHTMLLLKP